VGYIGNQQPSLEAHVPHLNADELLAFPKRLKNEIQQQMIRAGSSGYVLYHQCDDNQVSNRNMDVDR
jgi:hypothetical protein